MTSAKLHVRYITALAIICTACAFDLTCILEKLTLKHQTIDTTNPCVATALCNGKVTQECLKAISSAHPDFLAIEDVICSSICDSLFRVTAHCKGEGYAHEAYRLGCLNGYQGPKNPHWVYYSVDCST